MYIYNTTDIKKLGSGGGRTSLALSGYLGTVKFSNGEHMGSTYRQGCNSALVIDEGHNGAKKGGGRGGLLYSRWVKSQEAYLQRLKSINNIGKSMKNREYFHTCRLCLPR
jgi:hypothetical protein